MKKYIEDRAVEVATYIIENNATVRQAAKQFGISKSTVHMVITERCKCGFIYIIIKILDINVPNV